MNHITARMVSNAVHEERLRSVAERHHRFAEPETVRRPAEKQRPHAWVPTFRLPRLVRLQRLLAAR
jgi:hypothetical protein